MTLSNAQLIFERWESTLNPARRKHNMLSSTLDELFEELKSDGTSFDDARAILAQTIKVMQPAQSVVKVIYKNRSKEAWMKEKSEKEFVEEWVKGVVTKCNESFYAFFEIKSKDDDDDKEPKVYGNMSAREYTAQRRYAESFPVLDTAALEERMNQAIQYNLDNAINILGETDGNSDK